MSQIETTKTTEATETSTSEESTERKWPVTVTLKHPIDVGDKHIETITLRRGSLKQFKGTKLGEAVPIEQLMLIASRLSGQPIGVIESLDMEDAGEVMAAALDFYEKCLKAGKERSRP